MRNYFIAGNWKMRKTRAEAADLAKALVRELKDGALAGGAALKAGSFAAIPKFA